MSWTKVIFSATDCIRTAVSATACAARSASAAPFRAISSICRLLSALAVIDAVISSRLDVVSSIEAACSLVPDDIDCADAEIWPAAEASDSAACWLFAIVSRRRATIPPNASTSRPTSSLPPFGMSTVRSPAATVSTAVKATCSGRAIEWNNQRPSSAIVPMVSTHTTRITSRSPVSDSVTPVATPASLRRWRSSILREITDARPKASSICTMVADALRSASVSAS